MHPIATMCRVLGVSPGGYYARQKRPPSARAKSDAELSAKIAEIHHRSRQTYGAPRIHAELREQGIRVGGKRVARLMRAARLRGVSRRAWIITTQRDPKARPAPDRTVKSLACKRFRNLSRLRICRVCRTARHEFRQLSNFCDTLRTLGRTPHIL